MVTVKSQKSAEKSASSSAAMPLFDHLRELRNRLIKSAIAVVIGMVIGWIYYDRIFNWLSAPITSIIAKAQAQGHVVTLAMTGVTDPLILQMQIAAIAGLILSSPIWLYQLWRFITPGLHKHERRWAVGFVCAALPLFFLGVTLAYIVLPMGLNVLFGFTPAHVANIIAVDKYLSFFVHMLVIFGVGFLVPLILVILNFAGLLSGAKLLSWWRWIVFLTFLFAAAATPSGDPINMTLLALPILLLLSVAVIICLINDRRRRRRNPMDIDYSKLADDEISPLPEPMSEDLDLH